MAFSRMAYTPATGLKDTATFPTTPASEDAARKQIQDVFDQVTTSVNGLIDALEDDTSGSSGAENIGSKAIAGVEVSAGVSAVTVYDQIVAVKAIADSASAGVLTSGSISASNMFGSNVVPLAAMTANSVDSDQYVDGSIDHVHLAADAVDGTNIADDSVDSEHIAAGALDTEHYANLSVTEGKIATGAVTKTKLGATALAWTQIVTDQALSATSGSLSTTAHVGYNEIMYQIKDGADITGTILVGYAIVPLQASGIMTPQFANVYMTSTYTRQFASSATSIAWGQTTHPDAAYQKLSVFVR